VMGGRHRVDVLGRVAQVFEQMGYTDTCKFLVQSKPVPGASPLLTFFRERMNIDETADYVRRSEILIDIVRPGHAGLSFRFFEALLYRKKMITNNASVAAYDFYDPRNILIIDSERPKRVLNTPVRRDTQAAGQQNDQRQIEQVNAEAGFAQDLQPPNLQ
nr:hypothetical protein [Tanacetum cinerariifolium]